MPERAARGPSPHGHVAALPASCVLIQHCSCSPSHCHVHSLNRVESLNATSKGVLSRPPAESTTQPLNPAVLLLSVHMTIALPDAMNRALVVGSNR